MMPKSSSRKKMFVAFTYASLLEAMLCSLSSQEAPHLVAFVEPRGPLKTTGNSHDTSHIRALVSFALNLSTENPITIVSK